jgi:hypothetical protein
MDCYTYKELAYTYTKLEIDKSNRHLWCHGQIL